MTSLPKPAMFNLVHILTGMRRSGKTFQLFQLINDSMQSGVPRERMFYFNFSDERLQPMHRMSDVIGTIITLREEGTLPTDAGDINVIPAWKWALQSKN